MLADSTSMHKKQGILGSISAHGFLNAQNLLNPAVQRKGVLYCFVVSDHFSTEIKHLRSLVVHSVAELSAKILPQLFGTFNLSDSFILHLLSNHAFFPFPSRSLALFELITKRILGLLQNFYQSMNKFTFIQEARCF